MQYHVLQVIQNYRGISLMWNSRKEPNKQGKFGTPLPWLQIPMNNGIRFVLVQIIHPPAIHQLNLKLIRVPTSRFIWNLKLQKPPPCMENKVVHTHCQSTHLTDGILCDVKSKLHGSDSIKSSFTVQIIVQISLTQQEMRHKKHRPHIFHHIERFVLPTHATGIRIIIGLRNFNK